MALHGLADSTDLRLLVPHYRTYSLTVRLPILSGPLSESTSGTLLDDAQGILGQKALGRSRCISQTTLRHLQDFGLQVVPEFLRIVGIVRFAETFRKFPFVLLTTLSSRSRRTSSRPRLDDAISLPKVPFRLIGLYELLSAMILILRICGILEPWDHLCEFRNTWRPQNRRFLFRIRWEPWVQNIVQVTTRTTCTIGGHGS